MDSSRAGWIRHGRHAEVDTDVIIPYTPHHVHHQGQAPGCRPQPAPGCGTWSRLVLFSCSLHMPLLSLFSSCSVWRRAASQVSTLKWHSYCCFFFFSNRDYRLLGSVLFREFRLKAFPRSGVQFGYECNDASFSSLFSCAGRVMRGDNTLYFVGKFECIIDGCSLVHSLPLVKRRKGISFWGLYWKAYRSKWLRGMKEKSAGGRPTLPFSICAESRFVT